ncbi:MAG: tRNA (adenosine(37)-N6)-threonylcarbamoyltransferase complex dimerization subunit type 1 TsaB [Chitinophagaceae bacterium]
MATLLNIDTAVETASLCLANDASSIQFAINNNQRDHATWLHPAIEKMLSDANLEINDLDAVAVSIGPGSYTGLRVGLSAAKGICFALRIPLITIPTLEMMAYASINENDEADLFCPLVDARRLEVFMGIYKKDLTVVVEPEALVINTDSFNSLLATNTIQFSGNGSDKVKHMVQHRHASFCGTAATADHMKDLSDKRFREKDFADLAYTEPLYIKEFYSPAR